MLSWYFRAANLGIFSEGDRRSTDPQHAHLPCCAVIFFFGRMMWYYPSFHLPCCAPIFFRAHFYSAVLYFFFLRTLTLLCLNFFFSRALTLLCLNFFFRAHLPCCALIVFRAHLPCCALIFFFFFFGAQLECRKFRAQQGKRAEK